MQNTVFGGCARQWERGGGRENQYYVGGCSGRPVLDSVHMEAEKIDCAHTPPEGLPGDPQVCLFQLKVLICP